MANLGTYCNGDPFIVNPAGGAGVKFTSIVPAGTVAGDRKMHGAMVNPGIPAGGFGFDSLAADHRDPAYADAANVDPGNTGAPLAFAAGTEGAVLKAVSNPAPVKDKARDRLLYGGVMTVCAAAPPAGAFRPALAAPSKVSHWIEDDMDLTGLRSLPVLSSAPPWQHAVARQRWVGQSWMTDNDLGSRLTPTMNQEAYGANEASRMADAILLLSLDVDPGHKRDIAVALVQRGIDLFERVKTGASFNNGGGGHSSKKLPLAVAAHLLDDAEMKSYLGLSPPRFIEDMQYRVVDATAVASWGYTADMLGTPEWMIVPAQNTVSGPAPDVTYRAVNTLWQVGAALGLQLIGGRATYNNETFFNYVDRIMERQWHAASGPVKWATTLTSGGNAPTIFHKAMWTAYRTAAGMPAIWERS